MKSFLDDLKAEEIFDKDTELLFRGVSHDEVVSYFRDLHAKGLNTEAKYPPVTLADYIERRASDGGLTNWTICLKSISSSNSTRLIRGKQIGIAERSNQGGVIPRDARSKYVVKSVIGSIDESLDLDPNEMNSAKIRAEKQNRSKPIGVDFRYARPPERGLLIFYLLNDSDGIKMNELPYVSYCVSFPDDQVTGGQKVEYFVNSVWQQYE